MESKHEISRFDTSINIDPASNNKDQGSPFNNILEWKSRQCVLNEQQPRSQHYPQPSLTQGISTINTLPQDLHSGPSCILDASPDLRWSDALSLMADQSGESKVNLPPTFSAMFREDLYHRSSSRQPKHDTWLSDSVPPVNHTHPRAVSHLPLPRQKNRGHRVSLSESYSVFFSNPKSDRPVFQTEIPPGLEIPSFGEVQASIKRKRREAKYFNPQCIASFTTESSQSGHECSHSGEKPYIDDPVASTSRPNTPVVRVVEGKVGNNTDELTCKEADETEQIQSGEYALTICVVQLQLSNLGVSHQINPTEWMRRNKEHVVNITRVLRSLNSFPIGNIYPRFTVYTLAQTVFFKGFSETTKLAKIAELLNVIESWKAWDDISALANYQTVKSHLLTFLQSVHELEAGTQHHLNITLTRILDIDTISIDALLLETLQDRGKYKQLVRRRGLEAQSLLNLLQARMEFPLDPSLKRFHLGALIKLSRSSGLYPECMILKGIKLAGKVAIDFGGYGDIWKGLLAGEEIAVKVLRILHKFDKKKFLKEFSSEAVIWRQLNHPNVLPFYGVFHLEDDRLCLASPWMVNGNVVCFLESFPDTKCAPLMLDVALGLKYLHTFNPTIIHGDIKGVNILITQSLRACLADFGLAAAKETQSMAVTSAVITRATGTMRWQAPELMQDDDMCNSLASDIYAYGCVCYELFSGKLPFHDIQKDYWVMTAAMKGDRPLRPSDDRCRVRGLNDEIWNIIQTCWADEPGDRLSAGQIVEHLSSMSVCTDERSHDQCDPTFPSRTLYAQAEHPFSAFAIMTNGQGGLG